MAQNYNGCYNAEVEHCIENIGNDVYASDFISRPYAACPVCKVGDLYWMLAGQTHDDS